VTAPAGAAQIPDFDPAEDGVYERETIASMRDQLRSGLSRLELREEELARLRERDAHLEAELKTTDWHLTNALKDKVALQERLERPLRRG